MKNPRSLTSIFLACASVYLLVVLSVYSLGIIASLLLSGTDMSKKLLGLHPMVYAWICLPPLAALLSLLLVKWFSASPVITGDAISPENKPQDHELSWLQIFISAAGVLFLVNIWQHIPAWIHYFIQYFGIKERNTPTSASTLDILLPLPNTSSILLCSGAALLVVLFSRKLAELLHRVWKVSGESR
ncbi:MAG: hypothetical protein LBV12_09250 [Puniceicoccales bacterium]|jgi:hypothetical protein|nr:hypothetical protein [Puniceicoccales bacterium]